MRETDKRPDDSLDDPEDTGSDPENTGSAAPASESPTAESTSITPRPFGLDTRPTAELKSDMLPEAASDPKQRTDYVNVPEGKGVQDMSHRPPTPNTTRLAAGWRLRWRIGEEVYLMSLEDRIVVGRAMEGDTGIGFDLTPYGAYHFGVSRMHAVLTLHDGFLYLEDLNSTNGTRINGFQVTPKQRYRLRDGDEIDFARLRTTLKFEMPGAK